LLVGVGVRGAIRDSGQNAGAGTSPKGRLKGLSPPRGLRKDLALGLSRKKKRHGSGLGASFRRYQGKEVGCNKREEQSYVRLGGRPPVELYGKRKAFNKKTWC